MTLPLLVQDRADFHGIRYAGALASIHPDVEFRDHWEYEMEFQATTPPPFPWAGQRQEVTA